LLGALTLGVVGFSVGHTLMALSAGAIAATVAATPSNPPLPRLLPKALWIGSIGAYSYVGLASALVKAASGAVLAHAERRLAAIVAGRLRVSIVQKLLDNGLSLPSPHALSALAVRVREVEGAVASGVVAFVRAAVSLVPLAACLALLSPALSVAALVVVVPFSAVLSAFRKRLRAIGERAQAHAEALERGVDELVSNIDLFRTYGAGQPLASAVERGGDLAGQSSARADALSAALSGANEVLGALAVVGALALGARYGLAGAHSERFIPFAAVFFMAYRPLRDLGDARSARLHGEIALEAASAAFGSLPRVPVIAEQVADPWAGNPPTLETRAFGAAERGPATSLRVAPGEIVALVGPTGSGKTTFLRALLGLEPSRGELWLDERSLATAGTGPRERPFAWVPQEAPLVTGTILENVLLVGGSARAARDALRTVGGAGLLDGAASDVVGPGGRPLSGGERRQLSLARALATELPVLLLDEPTEGLDRDANQAMLDALRRLRGQRSVLVATHRDDVVAISDRVVRIGESDTGAFAAE
jgi:ABC-type multidrug transport system fused ATPase/permease subunit